MITDDNGRKLLHSALSVCILLALHAVVFVDLSVLSPASRGHCALLRAPYR